ncbi:MAG: urea carboxylase-associated family protein [Actinomycetota bacterium]|nr:urea carboxylase-associated family protein [Actinomycetota bacterium]
MERIEVPAREGRGVRLAAGRSFRVVDVEGRQCVDVFAFCADDVSEYHSAEHTRVHVNGLFPRPGEHFVTNKRRPILLFEEDATPGVHDMLIAACDPSRYEGLGVRGWHPSCQENLERAMAELGHERIEIPQPINLFTNVPVDDDGVLDWLPSRTEPGDYVQLRAEVDVFVVASSCPQDIVPINDKNPTRVAIELL